MENKFQKCTSKDHENIDAIFYCSTCQIYICNKCENFHSNLFPNHQLFNIEKDKDYHNILKEFCQEKDHRIKYEYFCRTHNSLCCAKCISKLKAKNNGKHHDCDICFIEDIKEEKMNKLNDNIKYLEEISINLNELINNLEQSLENINKNKEELKKRVQQFYTKIRNELNNKEEELLLKIDEIFDKKFANENMIKEYNKLPNKIKSSLEKNKNIKDESNLISLINQCLTIENNIEEIKIIKEKLDNCNDIKNNLKIYFYPDNEEEINKNIMQIKSYGKIFEEILEFKKSSIINNEYEKQEKIINWIDSKINKNKIDFKLIFKMSENGEKSGDFHKYCDDKGPTLSLIKTTQNRIFGGFTPLNWKNSGGYVEDKSNITFIFSLNTNKKFDLIKDDKQAIYCSSDYGVNFGAADFRLNKNLKEGITYANTSCKFLSNKNLELTGGKGDNEKFETEEFEVYQVIYN